MVVFTCQHCNEALKKPVVEKHYNTKCRRNPYLTCVDCLKDFRGDEYISHTSCVSEDQRYGDKNFVPKPVAVKQTNWVDVVHNCIKNNSNPKYFSSFQRLINCSNIPRKKPKFMNFMKNAMNMQNATLCEEIFDLFQKEFENFNTKKNDFKGNNNSIFTNEPEASEDIQTHQYKKKRNHLSETEIKDEGNVNNPADEKKKRPKKLKSDYHSDPIKAFTEVDSVSNDNAGIEDNSTNKKTKSKKKRKSSTQNKENLEESYAVENEATQDEIHETSEANSVLQEEGDTDNLSRKELKKLKKKKKFEAELINIGAEKSLESNELQEETLCDQVPLKTKSKKKKRKVCLSESEPDQTKKQKTEESIEPESTDNILNGSRTEEANRKVKFQWDEVIKQILHNSSDHEISLKRLTKKVLTEYQSLKGDRESYEELMSKFNKKINKIPGVKIIKDKARLTV